MNEAAHELGMHRFRLVIRSGDYCMNIQYTQTMMRALHPATEGEV